MVTLPGGSFVMGSPEDGPTHRVALDAFMMSATEVTQGQWQAVMPEWRKSVTLSLGAGGESSVAFLTPNPSLNRSRIDLPVENVTWFDCQEFIRRLNKLAGLKGRDRYRLPTEAEWEYACRAGKDTPFTFGRDPRRLGEHAWYAGNARKTQPVGQLRPNHWGLFDLHGNVAEWCADFFGPYEDVPARNPEGPASGAMRAVRGGSLRPSRPFDGVPHAWACRASYRQAMAPGSCAGWLGFRLARTVR
jgi:formylglycine-generating enzyme required for sulfatase activity